MLTPILLTWVFTLVGLVVLELVFRKERHQVLGANLIKPHGPCQPGKGPCQDNVDCLPSSNKLTCQRVSSDLADKRCLPKVPDHPCNEKLGGVWVWSGTKWFCKCTYPEIVGSNGCQQVNPNVCQGGKYTFDARKGKPPNLQDCQCKKGSIRFLDSHSIPVCITPQKNSPCYSKGSCAILYSVR